MDKKRILLGKYFKIISGKQFKMKLTTFDISKKVYSDDSITTCTFNLAYETAKSKVEDNFLIKGRIEGDYAKADGGVFVYTSMKVFAEPGSIVALRL